MKYYFYYFKLFDGSIKMSDHLFESFVAAQKAAMASTWFTNPVCVEGFVIKGIEVFKEESK